MIKIGRNAPCPCGSGKKFKKCCMMKKQSESLTRSMIRRKTDELLPDIMAYYEENYDKEIIEDAWGEFYGEDDDFDGNPYLEMFFRWFLFYWIPDESIIEDEVTYPYTETIGAKYLKANREQMDSLSIRVLESALNDPISFWQVTAVEPDRGILLKDLILGRERFVEEITGSRQLKQWDILLGNMQELDGVFVLNITGPYMLPPTVGQIIKESFNIDPESDDALNQLFDFDFDIIFFYQDIIDEMFAAYRPELRNMDGKELIFTKSTYIIDPSKRQEIIDILMDEESFDAVGLDNNNNKAFLWIGTPENNSVMDKVIKGHVKITPERLITECNSSERDNQFRKILNELLGNFIQHQKTESDPIDTMGPSEISENSMGNPLNLDELPEDVRDELIGNLESMYMKWADQSIPLLDNLTPREAVNNPEGRERVINLINDWENKTAHMENKQFDFNFNKLRGDLGLPLE